MPSLVIFGAQWGDEGKGKVVDVYSEHADACVRFNGGGNAGHTLVVGGNKVVLKHLPSCLLRDKCLAIIGNGVVVDPAVLLAELAGLHDLGYSITPERLIISPICTVVMPHHRAYEVRMEKLLGGHAIGTTKRGIGPAYADRALRVALRLGDLLHPDIVHERIAVKRRELAALGLDVDWAAEERDALEWGHALAPYMGNAAQTIRNLHAEGANIILEGAQGVLLDVDYGTYPYVTASHTTGSYAPAGCGIPPQAIDNVMGVCKAYCTRVGAGPFPTEESGDTAVYLRSHGNEFGSTTGRPRRVGWLDLASLREIVRATGSEYLTITKLDVLTGMPTIKVGMGYMLDGEKLTSPPEDITLWSKLEPIYEELEGWNEFPAGIQSPDDLPAAAVKYLEFVTDYVGVKLAMLSLGPAREQGIVLNGVW